ncbi:MAG: protein kinase [Gemmatimonadaceae bacterium]
MDALAQLNASLTGRYSIDREIGRGGMATVYLARDLRHSRSVAVKVLNPELGAVLGVERFLSEIRVTANLQHPNLLPLFDSGEAEGLLFYVMPFVEGESLRKRLLREKQFPIDGAIHIAGAVAGALDYAHRHGVIHRDLKPENILLSESQPLVADFGIALAVSKAGGERITQSGVSLGTPHYMSPEQATGDRAIDGRTDIYSLGAVLYEMLTGDPPHTASTAQALIAKVLTDAPRDVRVMRPHVPDHVATAIECALEKLPADRWPTAQSFAEALHGRAGAAAIPAGVRTPGTLDTRAGKAKWHHATRRSLVVSTVLAFVVGGTVALAWQFADRAADRESVTFEIEPPAPNGIPEDIARFAISQDGSMVAFVSNSDSGSQVYLRRLSELESWPMPGTNGAFDVEFSPDGEWLSVVTYGGKLLKVRVDGGSIMTIGERLMAWGGVAWESNNSILAGNVPGTGNAIARIDAAGGPPRPLTQPTGIGWEHGRPFVLNDHNTLLFMDWGPGFTEDDFLAIGSLKTGEYARTPLIATAAIGVVDNRIVYVNAAGAIMVVPFDRDGKRTTGDPVPVMEDVTITGGREASLSRRGTLAYKRGQPTQRLVLIDGDGARHELSSEDRTFLPPYWSSGRPTFSPDGRRIAVNLVMQRGDTMSTDIWTFDTRSRTFTRLTSLGDVLGPEWTPDGKHLVFSTRESRAPSIWRQVADGSQPPEKLVQFRDGEGVYWANATPDGRGVLYCHYTISGKTTNLFYVSLHGARQPERLDVGAVPDTCSARVSPDSQWLAYVGSDGGRPNVYVRPFRGRGGRVQVSMDGGDSPLWSRDGRRLFYRRAESGFGFASGSLVVAHVSATQNALHVVKRERLFALGAGGVYDVAPDGKQVLMLRQSDTRVRLIVTTNWLDQLRARLAGLK